MATKVALQYGVLTGQKVIRPLLRALENASFSIVQEPKEADIIIGHSGGCFWLPQAPTSQRLVLINPPYWPGRSVKSRIVSRTARYFTFWKYGYSVRAWLWRSWWGIYYGLTELPRHRILGRESPNYQLEAMISNHQALIIRNTHDDWLTPQYAELLKEHPGLRFFEVPGDHDNCWINPEPYVTAIQEFAEA